MRKKPNKTRPKSSKRRDPPDLPLCAWAQVDDDARLTDEVLPLPLTVQVKQGNYGINVCALGERGQALGEVVLDYHDNKLRGLIYLPDRDEPAVNFLLCEDVDAAREKVEEAK